jgi:hypothetical protein
LTKIQALMWRLIFIVILAASPVSRTNAQIGAPQPINMPVPNQWREPFEGFLRDLGVSDPKAMLDETKASEILGVWHHKSVLFRIEEPTACSVDMCLTVIGHIADNKFFPETMFTAGKNFTQSDHTVRLFGFGALPVWFLSDSMTVTLLETPSGWIVGMAPRTAP